mmetsp:Transcript_99391/g.186700  ORF Transcript_99391/g.186700 Transcript_99391/m.186700 type:complete len:479 (+) Transcript_99391:69-1505(+)
MQDAVSLPPGLEFLARGRAEPFMSTISFDQCAEAAAEEQMQSNPAPENNFAQQLVSEIKEAIESDLQANMLEKLESVWAQGERDVQQFQHDNRIYMDELQKSVTEFRERQEALERDSANLQQSLAAVLAQLGQYTAGSLAALGANNIFNGVSLELDNKLGEFLPQGSAGDTSTAAPSTSSTGSVSPPMTFEHSPLMLGSGLETPAHGGLNCYFEHASPYLDAPDMGSNLKLPDVPAFPFPTTPQAPAAPSAPSTAAPLSLASALGIEGDAAAGHSSEAVCDAGFLTPMSAPLSTPTGFEGLPSPPQIVPATAPPSAPPSAGGFIFSIMLRKAEGSHFGLELSPGNDGCLCIVGVAPGGAAEAWNRQCSSSGAAEKVLMPGDKLVSVNGVGGDTQDMRRECETQHLLRLLVVRCDHPPQTGPLVGPPPGPPPEPPAPKTPPCTPSQLRADASAFEPPSSQLRADASAFVPMSVSACTSP